MYWPNIRRNPAVARMVPNVQVVTDLAGHLRPMIFMFLELIKLFDWRRIKSAGEKVFCRITNNRMDTKKRKKPNSVRLLIGLWPKPNIYQKCLNYFSSYSEPKPNTKFVPPLPETYPHAWSTLPSTIKSEPTPFLANVVVRPNFTIAIHCRLVASDFQFV